MSDPVDLPPEPAPPQSVAPPHKWSKLKRIFVSIASNDFIQAGFILIIIASVAGASYYIGWHRGYDNATSAPANGQCSNLTYNPNCPNLNQGVDEPVINLYPAKTEQVNVQVVYPAGFTYTYPTYNPASGWNVVATPSGSLTNLADNKQYPYLVWEGNPLPVKIRMNSGFVVPGDQTSSFLHAELPVIGLSPSETNAFIAYWLPKMNSDTYNLIHFAGSEYTNYAKLIISPKPDSELRVMMAFQPLARPISIKPQVFPVFHRSGFTVVEWGGTKLSD